MKVYNIMYIEPNLSILKSWQLETEHPPDQPVPWRGSSLMASFRSVNALWHWIGE